jgi:hypothetical protein
MSDMRNPIEPSTLSRISELIEQIDPSELIVQSDEGYTPYRIAQIIRAALIDLIAKSETIELSAVIGQIDKIAQSQRIYNIARSGRIDGIASSHRIAPEQAERFIARYVASALKRLQQL